MIVVLKTYTYQSTNPEIRTYIVLTYIYYARLCIEKITIPSFGNAIVLYYYNYYLLDIVDFSTCRNGININRMLGFLSFSTYTFFSNTDSTYTYRYLLYAQRNVKNLITCVVVVF